MSNKLNYFEITSGATVGNESEVIELIDSEPEYIELDDEEPEFIEISDDEFEVIDSNCEIECTGATFDQAILNILAQKSDLRRM